MHHSGWLQSVTRLSHVKGNDRLPVIKSRIVQGFPLSGL